MRLPVAAAVLAVLAVSACGVPVDDEPRALDRGAAPFRVFEPAPAEPQEGEVAAELYLVRDSRVEAVERRLPRPGSPEQVLRQLFEGPTREEQNQGLSTSVPASMQLEGVEVRDGIAVVSLKLGEQVTTDQVVAFAQIVATLVARPDIEGVRFRTQGRDLDVPRGDGSLTGAPVNRQSYTEQLVGPRASPPVVPPEPVTPSAGPPAPTPAESPGG